MKLSLLLLLLLLPISLLVGSVDLAPAEVWEVLSGRSPEDSTARFIIVKSRMPQMVTALLSGAALAVSGLVMQTLFLNPLADPSLLGVHSGASLGAAFALLACGGSLMVGALSLSGVLLTVSAAFLGACGVIALLSVCSTFLRSNLSLLVTGIMLSFALSAVIALLNFYATADGVHSFVIWGMGNFSGVPNRLLGLYAFLILLPACGILCFSKSLNALLLGNEYASNLGIRIRRTRTILLLLTGFLTATVTALCGPISFFGLAVPHMARTLTHTTNHRKLLPACLILGADVALLSLIITHLPGEGGTLPLAAITPLMGLPVVLYILLKPLHRT